MPIKPHFLKCLGMLQIPLFRHYKTLVFKIIFSMVINAFFGGLVECIFLFASLFVTCYVAFGQETMI